jgi:hypothetical protein
MSAHFQVTPMAVAVSSHLCIITIACVIKEAAEHFEERVAQHFQLVIVI